MKIYLRKKQAKILRGYLQNPHEEDSQETRDMKHYVFDMLNETIQAKEFRDKIKKGVPDNEQPWSR
jgi:hypothetical protein